MDRAGNETRRLRRSSATADVSVKGVSVEAEAAAPPPEVKPSAPMPSRVQLIYPSKVIVRVPSGRTYVWAGAGSVVAVEAEDMVAVMSKNSNVTRGCCGSSGGRTYFQLAA